MEAIEIQNLSKKFKDVTAVDNLSLTIHQGELFALLGVNGAGKTTTIKMLSCLIPPTAGDALLLGSSILKDVPGVKSKIDLSPQETAVAPNLTVRENLEMMCRIYGFSREKTREMLVHIVEEFHLQEVLARKAGKLSGGWQRRLSIAMALVGQPRILFLDEPTLGLDVLARSELWDTIRTLKGKITVILTTHYMEEAQALSDRIGIMKNGRLLALGTARELNARTGCENLEQSFIKLVKGEQQ